MRNDEIFCLFLFLVLCFWSNFYILIVFLIGVKELIERDLVFDWVVSLA